MEILCHRNCCWPPALLYPLILWSNTWERGSRTTLQASLQQLNWQEKGREYLLTWKQQSKQMGNLFKKGEEINFFFSISLCSFWCTQNRFPYGYNVMQSLYIWNNRIICNNAFIYHAASDAELQGFALLYCFISFSRKISISSPCG